MRICQRWNWWSGRASTSSERRQSQVRGLSQGVLSRNDKISKSPSLKSRVYHWPLPIQPIRIHICQGLPSEFDNLFEVLPKDLTWYFHVHISYMHSVSMPSSGNSWKWRSNTLLDLTLCAEAAWISINPWIQLRFLGQEFGRWIALLFEATSAKFDFGEIMSRLSRWASFIQVWKEIFLFW